MDLQRGNVDPTVGADGAVLIADCLDAHPGFPQESGGAAADFAEPLDGGGRVLVRDIEVCERLMGDVHDAARGGGRAAVRSAEADRFTGDDAEDGMAGID